MELKPFEEIKNLFENRSYFVRAQFMEEYHFHDDYQSYYVAFIVQNAAKVQSPSYLSDLICFTIDQSIFDEAIVALWYNVLQTSTNAVVLLCALDYFNACPVSDLPDSYVGILKTLAKKHRRHLLLNQLYLNLLSVDEKNGEYKTLLLRSLAKTNDARSILRTIANLHRIRSKRVISELKSEIRVISSNRFHDNDRKLILERLGKA